MESDVDVRVDEWAGHAVMLKKVGNPTDYIPEEFFMPAMMTILVGYNKATR